LLDAKYDEALALAADVPVNQPNRGLRFGLSTYFGGTSGLFRTPHDILNTVAPTVNCCQQGNALY